MRENDSINKLLHKQAQQVPQLPETWHLNAYAIATRSGDTALTTLLAARSDAPVALTASFVAAKDPQIRIALLTRPGLDSALKDKLLREETRASVLARLVEGADAEMLAHVCATFRAKPTRVLAEALLSAANLDTVTKIAVVSALAPKFDTLPDSKSAAVAMLLKSVLTDENVDLDAVADAVHDSRSLSLSLACTARLPEATLLRLLPQAMLAPAPPYWMRGLPRVEDLVKRLYAAGMPAPDVHAAVTAALPQLDSRLRTELTETITLADTATTGDLDTWRTAAAHGHPNAAFTVITHPDATAGDWETFVPQCDPTHLLRVAADQPEPLRDVIARTHPGPFTDAELWDSYPDPDAARERVLADLINQEQTQRRRVYGTRDSVQFALVAAPDQLGQLPWRWLQDAALSWGGLSVTAAATIAALMCEQLDATEWATFATLAEEWDGTVSDLLATCHQL